MLDKKRRKLRDDGYEEQIVLPGLARRVLTMIIIKRMADEETK